MHTAARAVGSTPSTVTAFRSFFIGGFEGADHVNGDGVALDLNALTGHAFQLRGDYRRARALGIRVSLQRRSKHARRVPVTKSEPRCEPIPIAPS